MQFCGEINPGILVIYNLYQFDRNYLGISRLEETISINQTNNGNPEIYVRSKSSKDLVNS